MRICLYEDRLSANLAPLTSTRPAFDLLCGIDRLRAKQERYFQADVVGFLMRSTLGEQLREVEPHAPVNDTFWLRAGITTLVNGRWLPPAEFASNNDPRPTIALCQNEVAYARLPVELLAKLTVDNLDDCLNDWLDTLPRERVAGSMIRYPWDLLDHNSDQIIADSNSLDEETRGLYPVQAHLIGPVDRLHLDTLAHVDPCVVFDTTNGPIIIAAKARIEAFSHLQGPCFIGEGTHILGAKVRGRSSIGAGCRIGGVVEASILQGDCTIGQEVVLGHSVLGQGVTLAAGTRTATHHPDHSPIRIIMNGTRFDTLRTVFGSILGDHVTTGPGVLLNCGTVVGPHATLLPTGRLTPSIIPAYTSLGPDGMFMQPEEMPMVKPSRDR